VSFEGHFQIKFYFTIKLNFSYFIPCVVVSDVEDAVEAVVEVAEVDSKPNNLHYDQDLLENFCSMTKLIHFNLN